MATALNQNICFIGGGNMAQALIGGLLSRGLPTTRITVSDPLEQIRHILEEKGIQTKNSHRNFAYISLGQHRKRV